MRKTVIVLALVTMVGITISYAQTNIMGIAPPKKAQKEKLSDIMKTHVVGWNYVDEGNKWYKWGNIDPVYEYKVFAELYAETTESYEQDIPTKVYAGSVFIGKDLLAISSVLEPFTKYSYPSDTRAFATTFYRSRAELKTENYVFSYVDYWNSARYKVYIDDTKTIKEIFDFLKGSNNRVRFKTAHLNLKNGFAVGPILSSDLNDDMAIYSYNYDEIKTEKLDVSPKAPDGSEDLVGYIQSRIKCQDEWESGTSCNVTARFIVEKDGTISDLVLEGGDFFAREYEIVEHRWYYAPELITDNKIEGFNNQIASIMKSIKCIPAKRDGKPVRSYCKYNISYVVPNTSSSNHNNTESSKQSIDVVYKLDELDVEPSYKGGDMAMMQYIGKNIKYPPKAHESGIQGLVFVGFVVEADGTLSNVEVLKGIGGGCDEEAVRVVKTMPQWNPGKYKGKNVRASFAIPISFSIR